MNSNMTGIRSLHPCALGKISLSSRRVNTAAAAVVVGKWHLAVCILRYVGSTLSPLTLRHPGAGDTQTSTAI